MARSAFDILADLNNTMLKPQYGLANNIRNSYNPSPIDWASAVVPGTPGTAQQKALNSEIKNSKKKISANGGQLPDMTRDDPWYVDILNGLNGVGSVVTNQLGHWTDGNLDWKDIPLADSLADFGNGQWNAWTDGKIGFQDIPGFGGLVNMGKDALNTEDIFNNLGWKQAEADPNAGYNFFQPRKGQFDIQDLLGFVGDVALDPLTYLTFGGSSAVKAGLAGAKSAAKHAGEQLGEDISLKGGLNDIADRVGDAKFNQTFFDPKYNALDEKGHIAYNPQLVERLSQKRGDLAKSEILNAGKSARENAQNALFNFDVPFTNITKQFGSKPDFLKKAEQIIGATQVNKADQLLKSLGVNEDDLKGILSNRYGKGSLDQLNIQEFDDLMGNGLGIQSKIQRTLPQDIHTLMEYAGLMKDDRAINKMLIQQPEEIFNNSRKLSEWLEPYLDDLGFSKADGWDAKALHKTLENDPNGRLRTLQDMVTDVLQKNLDDVGTLLSRGTPSKEVWNLSKVDDLINTGSSDILKIAKSRKTGDSINDLLTKLRSKNRKKNLELADQLEQTIKGMKAKGFNSDSVKDLSDALLKHEQDVMSRPLTRKPAQLPDKIVGARATNEGKFATDMGRKSPLGAKLSRLTSGINARTFGSADEVVNNSAGKMLEAENTIHGHSIQMNKDIKQLSKAMKGLNEDEKRAIEYSLEGKAPKGTSVNSLVRSENVQKVKEIVNHMKQLYNELGQKDLQAGVIPKLRENYHHHSIKMTDEKREQLLKRWESDPILSKYLGRSASNRAGKERLGFQTLADMDNAIADLEKAMEAPDADVDDLADKINALKDLFERDPLKAVYDRYKLSIKSRAYKQMHNELEKDGLIVKHGTEKPIPAEEIQNYEKIEDPKLASKLGLEVGDRVHKDVLKGMQRVDKLFTDEGMNKFIRNFESGINVWRGLVTTNVPSHHFFNIIGNVANATMAGVTPKAYLAAGKMLMGKGSQKAYQKALDYGILHQGIAQDLGMMFQNEAGNLKPWEKAVFNNPWAKAMSTAGNAGDNVSRLALFLHILDKTGSAKDASDAVRRYLFNYREMTAADRHIRIAAPFWNWTKNNLPLQIQEFMRQPRYFATFNKLKEQFNGETNPNDTPDWSKDDYLKVPGMDNTYFNPRLPLQDLVSASDPIGLATGMISPVAKIPIELEMNKQFFNGQPVDSTYDPTTGYDGTALSKYLMGQLGIVGRYGKGAVEGTSPMDTFLQSILGKPQTFDPAKTELGNQYRERDALRSTIKRMKAHGQIQ